MVVFHLIVVSALSLPLLIGNTQESINWYPNLFANFESTYPISGHTNSILHLP